MNIEDIVSIIETNGNFKIAGYCVDCGKETSVSFSTTEDGSISIEGGAIFTPPSHYGYETKHVCKCDPCFKKDKKIHQINEVYTRCVGYYRPTSQMNDGKKSEISIRSNFEIPR